VTTLLLIPALMLMLLAPPASAERRGLFDQGKVSFGLSGGFGNRSVSVGGGFGYFVIDKLQPSVGLSYSYFNGDVASTHQLRTSLELRYYLVETDLISPFLFTDAAHIFMAYRGLVDEDHNFFYTGGGAGILLILGGRLGLTIGIGIGAYLGEDEILITRGVLPDGVAISGRFGLSFIL